MKTLVAMALGMFMTLGVATSSFAAVTKTATTTTLKCDDKSKCSKDKKGNEKCDNKGKKGCCKGEKNAPKS